jgi:hypothetical protein
MTASRRIMGEDANTATHGLVYRSLMRMEFCDLAILMTAHSLWIKTTYIFDPDSVMGGVLGAMAQVPPAMTP